MLFSSTPSMATWPPCSHDAALTAQSSHSRPRLLSGDGWTYSGVSSRSGSVTLMTWRATSTAPSPCSRPGVWCSLVTWWLRFPTCCSPSKWWMYPRNSFPVSCHFLCNHYPNQFWNWSVCSMEGQFSFVSCETWELVILCWCSMVHTWIYCIRLLSIRSLWV